MTTTASTSQVPPAGAPSAIAPPSGATAGTPPAAPTQDAEEQRRKHHFVMPEAAQYGISAVIDHGYGLTVGPWIRNHVEALLGHKVDEPYKPKNTAGFLTREIAYGISITYIDNMIMGMLLRRGGEKTGDMLTSATGAIGASAAAGAGMEASAAFRAMLGRNAIMVGAGVLFDAMWGAKIGNWIEGGVNKLTGHKDDTKTDSKITSNVNMSTVKQTPEQTARAFGRSFIATTSYTILWGGIGSVISRAVFTGIGGPVGAVLGTFVGTLGTTMMNHVVMSVLGTPAANVAQGLTRAVEGVLHIKKDAHTAPDAVPKIGDRAALSVDLTVVPFLTAMLSGQMGNYIKSVAP